MEKQLKKWGVFGAVCIAILASLAYTYNIVVPLNEEVNSLKAELLDKEQEYSRLNSKLVEMQNRLNQMTNTSSDVPKKLFFPLESDFDNESLFFTLYSDVIDLAKQSNIKIRSIDYKYNPANDPFVSKGGKDNYFVCDLEMKLISNYKDLRNFVELLYQYPHYIKFMKLTVSPYKTDKRILLSDFTIRLYSHTDVEKPKGKDL